MWKYGVMLFLLLLSGCENLDTPLNEQVKDYQNINNTNSSNNITVDTYLLDENISIEVSDSYKPNTNLRIASFNAQIFGKSKMNNEIVIEAMGNILEDYDIIAFQEIRDKSETYFPKFIRYNMPEYNHVVSGRLGRSTSKEQYAYIYSNKIQLISTQQIADPDDVFEREPFVAYFKINDNKNIALIQIHTKPTDAQSEIGELEYAVNEVKKQFNGDIFILGDLNADCSYYTPGTQLKNYYWLINDSADTTTSSTNCAYDRIITIKNYNIDKSIEIVDSGVDKYFRDENFSLEMSKAISDHYPVFVEMVI